MSVTTNFVSILDQPINILDGNEQWPVIGNFLTSNQIVSILRTFAGLARYWDCHNKAYRTAKYLKLPLYTIKFGSLMILSGDLTSSYGYFYDPPLEFHAWLEPSDDIIIDLALPGVIENGLISNDNYGPFLVNRKPFILAGPPLNWTRYTSYASFK